VYSGVNNAELSPDVQIVSPLDDFLSRHRVCKALIPFSDLHAIYRKYFYGRAANYYIEFGGGIVTYIFAAEEIARQFRLAIVACDRPAVHQSVRNRVLGKQERLNVMVILVDDADVVEVAEVASSGSKTNVNRVGKCGRKRKEDGALPSNKLKKPSHGAASFLRHQELCKTEATVTSLLMRDEGLSNNAAGKSMQEALMESGVSLHASTCREHVKRALANGCIGLDPQRNGCQALPSATEKDIAHKGMHLRERQFPVLPDDVMQWAAGAIEGSTHAAYFTQAD